MVRVLLRAPHSDDLQAPLVLHYLSVERSAPAEVSHSLLAVMPDRRTVTNNFYATSPAAGSLHNLATDGSKARVSGMP